MVNRKNKLSKKFSALEKRLYSFKKASLNPIDEIANPYPYSIAIDKIIKGCLKSSDLEDTFDFLYFYIEEIEDCINNISSFISNYSFKDDTRNVFTLPIKKAVIKKEFKKLLLKEFHFYLKELKELLGRLQIKFSNLGDERFSNAGFKIQLNLNVPEIGTLFKLLSATGIIILNKSDGKPINHTMVAQFINANFYTGTSESISINSLKYNLSGQNQSALRTIQDKLEKIINYIDTVS